MTKNTSKMTLYEVTNKVAKINKKKAPDVEELPEQPQKPEKINKKLKMPLVIPDKGRPRKSVRFKNPISSRFLRQHRKKMVVIAAVLLVWMGVSSLRKGGQDGVDVVASSPSNPEVVDTRPSDLPIPDVPIRVLNEKTIEKMQSSAASKPVDPVLDVHASQPSIPVGDHVIVLAHYITRDQLVPVKQYFSENCIETVIEKSGRQYVLMTKERFMNPNRRGNDGYAAVQKLKQIGSLYKPPTGFLPFKFDDIYGKKID